MPQFSRSSIRNLSQCHTALNMVARDAIALVDFGVICGYRGKETQLTKYQSGVSKVTWPNSKHNQKPSRAMDFAPWHPDFGYLFGGEDQIRHIVAALDITESDAHAFVREQYTLIAGVMIGLGKANGTILRWGGDWDQDGYVHDNAFDDLGHVELA